MVREGSDRTRVDNALVTRIAVVGGGPGGYEAALVAAQLGAQVTVVDGDGLGGACVLSDCVPSKTLISTSEVLTGLPRTQSLGVLVDEDYQPPRVDLPTVNARIKQLALAQSRDIASRAARPRLTAATAAFPWRS